MRYRGIVGNDIGAAFPNAAAELFFRDLFWRSPRLTPPPPQGIIKKQIHRTGGPEMTYTAAVITVSDSTSMGQRTDTSGPAICSMLEEAGYSGIHTAHRAG